jgi:hypothetical protein
VELLRQPGGAVGVGAGRGLAGHGVGGVVSQGVIIMVGSNPIRSARGRKIREANPHYG